MTPSNPKPGEGHTPTPETAKALKRTQGMFRAAAYTNGFADHAALMEQQRDSLQAAHARLLASNAEMREALEPFAGIAVEYWPMGKEYADISMKRSLILAARAALARHPDKEDAP